MAGMRLTPKLEDQYCELYDTIEYTVPQRVVTGLADQLIHGMSQYKHVELDTDVPWLFVGIVHIMESGGRFSTHLHNGDVLDKRTTHVPAGRPKRGAPPFEWHESATDAIKMRKWPHTYMSIPRCLFYFERWNGWGYRNWHPEVLSPYLWAGSQHYDIGKYGADGVFSETLRSKQIGAAVILRRFVELFENNCPEWLAQPSIERRAWVFRSLHKPAVKDLQRYLNRFDGIHIAVDGDAGPLTSDAFLTITGHYLQGDTREVAN